MHIHSLLSLNSRKKQNQVISYYLKKKQSNFYVQNFLSNVCYNIQFVLKNRIIDFDFIRKIGITFNFKHKILENRYYYNNTSSIRYVKKNEQLQDQYFLELIKIQNRIQFYKLKSEFVNEQNHQ